MDDFYLKYITKLKKNNDGYLAKLQSNQLDITTRNWQVTNYDSYSNNDDSFELA
jgi:hypothetical protein